MKWLGITISPSYVGELECNGVIERFMRTLKEQVYLSTSVPESNGGAADHPRVHLPLQYGVAH